MLPAAPTRSFGSCPTSKLKRAQDLLPSLYPRTWKSKPVFNFTAALCLVCLLSFFTVMRFDRTPYPQPHSLLCLNITAKVRLGSRARASRKAQGMRYGSGVSGRNCLYFRSGQGRRETNYCISLPWDFTSISLHLERVSGSLQKHTQVTKTTRKIQSKPASKIRMKRSGDQARLLEVGPAIDQGFPKAIQEGCPFLVCTGQTRCTTMLGEKGPAGPVANFPF